MIISKPKFDRYLSIDLFIPECRQRLKEYICILCEGVYHNPVIVKCGHVFCKSCVNMHLEFSEKCPQCGKLIEKNRIQSIKFVIEIVDKQNIYCKNRNQGCEWIGKVPELEIHLRKCAPDKFQNGNCFSPEKIVSNNNFTDEMEKTNFINNELLSSQREDINLENRCEEIDLCESKKGESSDENEMIECVFSKFGCKAKFSKLNSLGHSIENINVHNDLLNEWVLGFQNNIISRFDHLEKKIPLTIPSTASSIAASSKTKFAALPPSSNVAVFLVAEIDLAIALPTSVEPVNAILFTSGWLTSAAPVTPSPVTIFTTPSGTPAC